MGVKGFADGFVVSWSNANTISISAGVIEANGRNYVLTTNPTHLLTSPITLFERIYIYLDDSASGPLTPIFFDKFGEPVFDPVKRGWYNGDDRMIGVVITPNGSATIDYFDNEVLSGNIIRSIYAKNSFLDGSGNALVNNGNPSGVWQTTGITASTVLPVNAIGARLLASNLDIPSDNVFLFAASQEYAAVHTSVFVSMAQQKRGWRNIADVADIPLGASRNIKWAGRDINDNFYDVNIGGITYTR